MTFARALVLCLLLSLCVLTGILLAVGRGRRAAVSDTPAPAAAGADLATPAGYARKGIRLELELVNDDELQVYLAGKVVNVGGRGLAGACLKFRRLDAKGGPVGKTMRLRLGALRPEQAREIRWPVFALKREQGRPVPGNKDLLYWPKPRFRAEVYKARFASR